MAFRKNAACILIRERDSKIVIAERLKQPGAWQFPQGGVDEGESTEDAMFREAREELGVCRRHLRVLESREGYRYEFPPGTKKSMEFDGQDQTYFLCLYLGRDRDIDVATPKPEFRSHRWILARDFRLAWLPEFKREVYRRVFQDFFGVDIS